MSILYYFFIFLRCDHRFICSFFQFHRHVLFVIFSTPASQYFISSNFKFSLSPYFYLFTFFWTSTITIFLFFSTTSAFMLFIYNSNFWCRRVFICFHIWTSWVAIFLFFNLRCRHILFIFIFELPESPYFYFLTSVM